MPPTAALENATPVTIAAAVVVAASGVFLLLLAATVAFAPRRAERLLMTFASSLRAHVTEQVVRLIAGGGLVVYAPHMRVPVFFEVLGWVLIATSAVLLLIPWRWHHRFGQWAIPLAIRHMKLYGFAAFALGTFVLVAMT